MQKMRIKLEEVIERTKRHTKQIKELEKGVKKNDELNN